MSASPLGSYVPGTSALHRVAPGPKLLGLFVFAAVTIAFRTVPSTLVALVIAGALVLSVGLGWRAFGRSSLRFALIGVPLFAFQAWQQGWERGFAVVGTLFALILAASALTASTRVEDLIDTITRVLGPFRRFGAQPERVALAFSLVLRMIPTLLALAQETRTAAQARGLERHPRALMVPLVLRTVSHAQHTGEALHARGIGDD